MYDPDRYRDKAEIERWKERDPIALLRGRLEGDGLLAPADVEAIDAAVTEEIDAAVAFAEAGTLESVEDLTRFVYSEARP
jgi:pyruvate dehydrogenase E1 component alpha subunit